MTEPVFCHKLRSRFDPVFAEVVTSDKGWNFNVKQWAEFLRKSNKCEGTEAEGGKDFTGESRRKGKSEDQAERPKDFLPPGGGFGSVPSVPSVPSPCLPRFCIFAKRNGSVPKRTTQ
jgi:hypothetical protein